VTAALELIGVTSGYGSSPVVHGVSLQIAPGEILALVGREHTVIADVPYRRGH
jgi:ABC-type multidrug transport system ATPase subunit